MLEFLNLIRSVFPRWSFFDRVGPDFILEFQARGQDEWTRVTFLARRRPLHLLLNPICNMMHAEVSALENFAAEAQMLEREVLAERSPYRILRALVAYRSRLDEFRFRVRANAAGGDREIFESEWVKA